MGEKSECPCDSHICNSVVELLDVITCSKAVSFSDAINV